jgi:Protein of unknown function (DUF3108)
LGFFVMTMLKRAQVCGVLLAFAAGGAAVAQAPTAQPLTAFSVTFGIVARGVSVGTAAYNFSFTDGRYSATATRRATGVARDLVGTRQDYQYAVSGLYDGTTLRTRSFRSSGGRRNRVITSVFSDTAVTTTANMEMNMGNPPATAAQRSGVVDDVTMLGRMLIARNSPCIGTVRVLAEGRRRFDLVMSANGTQNVNIAGFRGQAVRCSVRFNPIAGFSDPIDPGNLTFLFANSGGYFVPVQIEMPTEDAGTVRFRATRFSVTGRR